MKANKTTFMNWFTFWKKPEYRYFNQLEIYIFFRKKNPDFKTGSLSHHEETRILKQKVILNWIWQHCLLSSKFSSHIDISNVNFIEQYSTLCPPPTFEEKKKDMKMLIRRYLLTREVSWNFFRFGIEINDQQIKKNTEQTEKKSLEYRLLKNTNI